MVCLVRERQNQACSEFVGDGGGEYMRKDGACGEFVGDGDGMSIYEEGWGVRRFW